MIEGLSYWLIVLGKAVLATSVVMGVGVVAYVYVIKDWLEYKSAKLEIEAFVLRYKRRCTGNNRFVVTVETLQDSFREYDTKIIERVWQELVKNHVVVSDPNDHTWCVR